MWVIRVFDYVVRPIICFKKKSAGSEVKRLSGKGEEGYSDGEVISARFRKPRSFAVDLTGNVYVADQANHAIRKITKSGTLFFF